MVLEEGQTHSSSEESRNGPHMISMSKRLLTNIQKQFNGGRIVFSINGVGRTRLP